MGEPAAKFFETLKVSADQMALSVNYLYINISVPFMIRNWRTLKVKDANV